jgi:hypothetical protein
MARDSGTAVLSVGWNEVGAGEITILVTLVVLMGVALAWWIYFAIAYTRWAKLVGAPLTVRKTIDNNVRFFARDDRGDMGDEAREARAHARRVLRRAVVVSIACMVTFGVLIVLLAILD